MNVLVTGASGLVGNAICNWFLSNNNVVTGVVNNSQEKINHANYSQLSVDLSKDELNLKDPFDAIIHCAAILPHKNQNLSEQELINISQKIDKSVFDYCQLKQIKVIYLSGIYSYQENNDKLLKETNELNPNLSGYYLSKKISEEFLSVSKIKHIVFRVSSPYGCLANQSNVMKIFNEKIENNLPITLIGKGERQQNFIHTDDISEACYRSLIKDIVGVFNLAYEKNYSMIELASILKDIHDSRSEFIFDTNKKDVKQNLNFDNSKLKKELDWLPKIDLKSGLLKMLKL